MPHCTTHPHRTKVQPRVRVERFWAGALAPTAVTNGCTSTKSVVTNSSLHMAYVSELGLQTAYPASPSLLPASS